MTGSTKRIAAIVVQDLYLTKHSLEVIIDTLIFPLMNVILFGLITRFLTGGNRLDATYLVLGVLLWEIIGVNQYNVTVSSMWSIWSHNLTNIFIAPISTVEYITAEILAAFIRTLVVLVLLTTGCGYIFHFNLLHVGILNLILFTVNLSIFAWWIGIVLLGLIFRYGQRIQAIAWGTIFIIQPLTASFYPVSILPKFLQDVAHALPATYVFEAGRKALTHSGVDWRYMAISFILNIGYSIIAGYSFVYLFRKSKASGQFARNDT